MLVDLGRPATQEISVQVLVHFAHNKVCGLANKVNSSFWCFIDLKTMMLVQIYLTSLLVSKGDQNETRFEKQFDLKCYRNK